jgi:hypothetical protein
MEVMMPWLTDALVAQVRLEMAGRGFALIGTPPFFDGDLGNRLRRCRTTLPYHAKRWRQFPQLARYGWWLEELLGQAMPDEGVALSSLEFRREPAGSIDEEVTGCTRMAGTCAQFLRCSDRPPSTATAAQSGRCQADKLC